MARLPETVPLLGIGSPLEVASACIGSQLLNDLCLLFYPMLRTMELQEKCRRNRQISFGITVDGIDLCLIKQFDTRNRNAILNRRNDGSHGAIEVRKGAHCRRNRFRNAV